MSSNSPYEINELSLIHWLTDWLSNNKLTTLSPHLDPFIALAIMYHGPLLSPWNLSQCNGSTYFLAFWLHCSILVAGHWNRVSHNYEKCHRNYEFSFYDMSSLLHSWDRSLWYAHNISHALYHKVHRRCNHIAHSSNSLWPHPHHHNFRISLYSLSAIEIFIIKRVKRSEDVNQT